MRIHLWRAVAGLLCALTLSCTDPSPTFVFDAAIDVPRDVGAPDIHPDVSGAGGANGSGGAGGSGPDGGTP